MNMHLLNCNKTDAEYLHVKFSMVFFWHVFFLPAAELHVTEQLMIYVLSQEGGASSDSVNTDPC